jgi:hypothetical protein
MKQDFPNRVNPWPLNMTLAERNATETTDKVDIVDLMFAVRELEKYVLTIAGVISPVVTVTTETSATVDLSSINSQLSALSSQIALLPAYLSGAGTPTAGVGKNGDTYWDTVGLVEYRKLGGTWRQLA